MASRPPKRKIPGIIVKKKFQSNLIHRMEELGLDNKSLAELLDIGQGEVYRYSKGLRVPNWDRYGDLCVALEVAPAYFLSDN